MLELRLRLRLGLRYGRSGGCGGQFTTFTGGWVGGVELTSAKVEVEAELGNNNNTKQPQNKPQSNH